MRPYAYRGSLQAGKRSISSQLMHESLLRYCVWSKVWHNSDVARHQHRELTQSYGRLREGHEWSPEIVASEHRLRRVEHPATPGSPLRVVGRNCVGDVGQQPPHYERQQHPVAPGAGVPDIQMIPPRLDL